MLDYINPKVNSYVIAKTFNWKMFNKLQIVAIKRDVEYPHDNIVPTGKLTHPLVAQLIDNDYYIFGNLTSKSSELFIKGDQFKKFQDKAFGIFQGESSMKELKKQRMAISKNIGIIPKDKIIVLAQGNEYLNSVEKDIKVKIMDDLEPILTKPVYVINIKEIDAQNALRIIKAYDHFAQHDRKNFPKTAEQITHLKNQKLKNTHAK